MQMRAQIVIAVMAAVALPSMVNAAASSYASGYASGSASSYASATPAPPPSPPPTPPAFALNCTAAMADGQKPTMDKFCKAVCGSKFVNTFSVLHTIATVSPKCSWYCCGCDATACKLDTASQILFSPSGDGKICTAPSGCGKSWTGKNAYKFTKYISFANLKSMSDYTADVKMVYETGFGIATGLYSAKAKSFNPGCSVSSTSARRSVELAFNGVASGPYAATAKSKSGSLTDQQLINGIKSANVALGKSVAVPTTADVLITNSSLSDIAKALAGWIIAVIVISVVVCCCGPLLVFCCCFGGAACILGASSKDTVTAQV